MATLPRIEERRVGQSRRGVATMGNTGAVADAVGDLGREVQRIGLQIEDREASAVAKERDAYVSDEIRRLIYDPETGFANKRGRDAIDARKVVSEQLSALKESAKKGLPQVAIDKLESSLQSRIDGALGTVDRHTANERNVWLDGASQARIEAAGRDAIVDFSSFNRALSTIETEYQGLAERYGWSREQYENEVRKAQTNLKLGVLQSAPAEKRIEMLGGYLPLESDHGTAIEFELDGKRRPNPPAQSLQNVLGHAARAALGEGARVVIYSGQESEGDQHGSNRHKTGLAADVRVYDGSGKLLSLGDPRAKAFMVAAARLGARGIGAGSEYMGDAFHIDMVPHEDYSENQGPVWGSASKAIRADILAAMSEEGEPAYNPERADARFSDLSREEGRILVDAAVGELSEEKKALRKQAVNVAQDRIAWNVGGRQGEAPPEPQYQHLTDAASSQLALSERVGDAVQQIAAAPIEKVQSIIDSFAPSGQDYDAEQAVHQAVQEVGRSRIVQSMAAAGLRDRAAMIEVTDDPVLRQLLVKQQQQYAAGLKSDQVGLMRQSGINIPELDGENFVSSLGQRFDYVKDFASRSGVNPVLLTPEERIMFTDSFEKMPLNEKLSFLTEMAAQPDVANAFFGEISKSAPFLSHVGGVLANGGDADGAMVAMRGYQASADGMKFDDLSTAERGLAMSAAFMSAMRGMPDVLADVVGFAGNYARGMSLSSGGFVDAKHFTSGLEMAIGETYQYDRPGTFGGYSKALILPPGVEPEQMTAFLNALSDDFLKGQNEGALPLDVNGDEISADYIRANADYMTVGPGVYVVEFDGEPVIASDGSVFTLRYGS